MRRAARLAAPVLAFAAIAAALLIGIVRITGSALVIDRATETRSSTIVSVDGEIEPRCHGGARTRAGA